MSTIINIGAKSVYTCELVITDAQHVHKRQKHFKVPSQDITTLPIGHLKMVRRRAQHGP